MKDSQSRRQSDAGKKAEQWPKKITEGRVSVTIYRRKTPSGNYGYLVENYAGETRKLDSYSSEGEALEAARALAKRLSKRDVVAASMTKMQAIDYASAVQTLEPFGLSLAVAATTLAEVLKVVGGVSNLHEAATFYATRHKHAKRIPVTELVADLLKVKAARGASIRYLKDLRYRLNRFGTDCKKDACNVTTADIQEWLDNQGPNTQSYTNFKRVLHLLFEHAVNRSYAIDNPVAGVDKVKVHNGTPEIFTPGEIARLLAVAPPDFLPGLAIGAFAGLRSAEIERLGWPAVDLVGRQIVLDQHVAKTRSRRIVPIHDNLAAWLAPYAGHKGKVWPGTHDEFYERQQETAAATAVDADEAKGIKAQKAVEWKQNGLRHSYASYRLAVTADDNRVAAELGNSASMVHKHYKELVKKAADAEKWFNVKPDGPANVLTLPAAATA